jgi:phosphoribosylformylglycinamidine synthase
MASDSIVANQDMRAAGLTSASVEMAVKGGLGITLDLDQVPIRETGMIPYEIMLSESQERMLMVLKPGSEATARAVFEKWELDFANIGTITDTGRLVLTMHGRVAADMPLEPLFSQAPLYDRPHAKTPPKPELRALDVDAREPIHALKTLIACPDLASKRWIWEQYDHLVMGRTVQRPGGDAAVVQLPGKTKGLAITSDCTPRYCYADPHQGGAQAVAETWRNITATGAEPLAATDNLNFGNPEKPDTMGQFVKAIQGIGEACRALDFPIVSGNVSLYNETNGVAILPTPTIAGVGLLPDWSTMARIGGANAGDQIVLIGADGSHLGQSVYLRDVLGIVDGPAPEVDLVIERRNGDFVRSAIRNGQFSACHDISSGGLAVALAEMAMASGKGMEISLKDCNGPAHALLFGEDQARYVVAMPADMANFLCANTEGAGVPFRRLGTVGGTDLVIDDLLRVSIEQLRDTHESWFPDFMDGSSNAAAAAE